MSNRDALTDSFLSRTDWADARRGPLAGDASNRRYERLTDRDTGETVVLMDAPPEKGEDVRPFVRIAKHLCGVGLSAPTILAEDVENGFLLIEDLGDALFARVVRTEPGLETTLYEAAIDVLLKLHGAPLPELETYAPSVMTDLSALAYSKYRGGIVGDTEGEDRFRATFHELCADYDPAAPVLIQRDYHAENLLWLPDRTGAARVGLLDFQDAMLGHSAYDLVSLLQDARRDVSPELEAAMINRYLARSGADPEQFTAAYAVLGTQRNLRIIGVFARLGLEYGKPHYVDLIPRVWAHLMRDLVHPALQPIANLLRNALPTPTPENLEYLKPT
ncbi:aminoglycoside phosphotransferase family protein [Sedimentitalea todarodis]|uniref:Phosphotransferase n=1 Tax=Sedimentitalea todarodis TaxID=1631240 RepID=A0ABU3VIM1_9RHOB|nr:phosphotransferase [Sedimentitalea todarodis]MDU9006037.1 phosphotransferase [Sedimentitalea todarodis]